MNNYDKVVCNKCHQRVWPYQTIATSYGLFCDNCRESPDFDEYYYSLTADPLTESLE